MAQYKVIQDIEAEDKLLGPLSLRQFLYAVIVIVLGFVGFRLASVAWYLALPFVPPIAFFGLLAAPFGRDQPSEVWLLSKIRFFLKPRKRIWDQSGLKELVTITVPKKIEKIYTKGFSQDEVKSRLSALASTLDTRGWAVKNVDANTFQQPVIASGESDRLVPLATMPQAVPNYDLPDARADVLDEQNNPVARSVDTLMTVAEQQHRQALMDKMRSLAAAQPQPNPTPQPTVTASTADQAMLEKLKEQETQARLAQSHMKTIAPLPAQPTTVPTPSPGPAPAPVNTPVQPVTAPSDPAILRLVKNDDLNVATIARQAGKEKGQEPPDEVVISLR